MIGRSRLPPLRKTIASLLQPRCLPNIPIIKSRQYASKSDFCDAHMNELPIPCGDFDLYYSDCQSFYNKVFVGGILWFVFSFGFMVYSGSFFLNIRPPSQPGPPSDMVLDDADKTC
nr:uncharacterized protein LOC128674783 [Plodia interpunctella]